MIPATSFKDDNLDMDKIIRCMTGKLNSFRSLSDPLEGRTRLCSIHRIPHHIREIDRAAYEPIILSIGPYHHGAESLQSMERQKWEILDFVLKIRRERSLQDYLKAIAGLEKLARKCYSEEVTMERKQFLQMLLLDGCFILVNIDKNVGSVSANIPENTVSWRTFSEKTKQRNSTVEMSVTQGNAGKMCSQRTEDYVVDNSLLCEVGEANTSQEEPLKGKVEGGKLDSHNFGGDWRSNYSWHDMLLLENQIPLMVVVKIYELLVQNDSATEIFRQKAAECMEDVLSSYPIAIQEYNRPRNAQHLLRLCHMYLKPSKRIEQHNNKHQSRPRFLHRLLHFGRDYISHGNRLEGNESDVLPAEQVDWLHSGDQPSRWRRATQYHEAGVWFKRREYNENNRHSLLDIKFSNGNIEVPLFVIDENTESLFKNLIALEQMDPRFGNDITTYIIFMSQFVSNPDDVTLLTQKGILVHMLDSDDEVSALFTRLTRNVAFNPDSYNYLKSLCSALERHYQSRLRRWMAWLWRNHFKNPWLALAVLATVIVLICTVVQTVYTVLPYLKS